MKKYKRVTVKIGTKVVTTREKGLDRERIKDIVDQISDIKDDGAEVLIVTSGAIGAGMGLLGLKKRPTKLSELQAAAAIGQGRLMQLYSELFKARGYLTGQVLLTQEDFDDRARYLNIKHTISTLLKHRVIPVINENDTVSTDEIRCGDNDRLSSLVTDLCGSDLLVMLTDVDGLLDADGRVISVIDEITPAISRLAGRSRCDLGTGGMATKICAVKSAMTAGIECVIANGRKKDAIVGAYRGEDVGTVFKRRAAKMMARKRWIAFSSKPKGEIRVDSGARDAVSKKDKSLLASGIQGLAGDFVRGDVVRIVDKDANEFARGVVNYSAREISKIKGLNSREFKNTLGYKGPDEVVHKDNLVIL